MRYSELQLRDLSRELIKDGFFFYQLSFVWGFTPGIRNKTGTLFYFLVDDRIQTPAELHEHLVATWRPAAQAEVLYFNNRLAAHFAMYPKDIPQWQGVDAREVLCQTDAMESSR